MIVNGPGPSDRLDEIVVKDHKHDHIDGFVADAGDVSYLVGNALILCSWQSHQFDVIAYPLCVGVLS